MRRDATRVPTAPSQPKRERYEATDSGLAERLIDRHGTNMRYCAVWSKWLVWDGRRWVEDRTGRVQRWGKETIRAMYAEAGLIEDDAKRERFLSTSKAVNRQRGVKV